MYAFARFSERPNLRISLIYLLLSTVLSLFFYGCASSSKRQIPIRFDHSLVRSYRFDLEKLKPHDTPFVTEYQHQGKKLFIIAVEHIASVKYPDLHEHPTIKTIDTVFQSLKPRISVIEGVPSGQELNEANRANAKKCKLSNYLGECGESFFVINKVLESKTQVVSGEPKEEEIVLILEQSGFSKKDILAFYLLRKVSQWKRQKNNTHKAIEELARKELEEYRERIDPKLKFNFEEFRLWYTTNMLKPRDWRDFANDDPAPHGGLGATYVQKISNRVTLARDKSLLSTIEVALNSSDRVLVVYGGSHYINIEPALTQVLGLPKVKKHF